MKEIKYIHRHGKASKRAIFLAFSTFSAVWLFALLFIVNTVMPVGHADAPRAVLDHPLEVTPTPTSLQQQEIDYINQVFGSYAPKAFSLLYGTKDCIGENPSLNPNAVNINWIKGQPGKYSSKDYGLFQWNDYWNGFNKEVNNERYLFDYKIATNLAYRKFVNDGYSFREWTSGKCQGI